MTNKLSLLIILVILLTGCGQKKINKFQGQAFGTYYAITYVGTEDEALQNEVEAVLDGINNEFSIFCGTSTVSKLNRNEEVSLPEDFVYLLKLSNKVSTATDGAFDITAAPLITFWGFGSNKAEHPVADTTLAIDSIRQFVGYEKLHVANKKLQKEDSRIQLDFNAIAKGYAVDKVARLLESKGIADYIVDIGGELRCKGRKNAQQEWNVGIQVPTTDKNGRVESSYRFVLGDRAVATSGNYRNYKEENGERYSHIINPQTGFSEKSNLLSVTVIADDCATADAYATAFMVMGREKAMRLLENGGNKISAHFIYFENGQYQYAQSKNFPKKNN
ncbi:MAG: FAD:protein FMN transferase [Bacteroidales bacterium]|nr:FAD:protein FMN transferase [Bacteroidales bacterium]